MATPITTVELLTGKALSAVIPAVLATWLAYALYAVGAVLMLEGDLIIEFVFAPAWLTAIFIVGPLMSFLSVCIAVLVSSRVTDPRVAEQLSGFVIMPIILLILGQSFGWIIISRELIFLLGAITLVLDIVLAYVTVHSFQRETILTQWK